MNITSGCLLDVVKSQENNGDIIVQAMDVKNDVEVILSDGEYFAKAKFPKGHGIHKYQRVVIQSCIYVADKHYIQVSAFHGLSSSILVCTKHLTSSGGST